MNTKSFTLGLSLLLAAVVLRAEEPLIVPLWTNGAPGFEDRRNEPELVTKEGRVKNVNNPTLTIFLPPPDKANGAAVLICPGGGFSQLTRIFHHTCEIDFSVLLRRLTGDFQRQWPAQTDFFHFSTHAPLPPLFNRAGDSTGSAYPVLKALATWAKMF